MLGYGLPIDPARHFIVCANVLGSCMGSSGPASTNPETGAPYGMEFPVITIRDMVRAQAMLLDHLGIERLEAVVGGSMGGKIGRAHVCTTVTNAHLVCRLLLEKKNITQTQQI